MGKILAIFRFSNLLKLVSILTLLGLILGYLSPFVHPSTFWAIPFFGLAYPVFISITLILLIIWAFLKSRWFFVVLAFILIGGKLHFRMITLPFGQEELAENVNSLKLVSYNVRLFDLYNFSETGDSTNRNGIFSYLKESNADVVCFQEFYQQDKPTNFPTKDTLIHILDATHFHDRYSHQKVGRQKFGIAMFSKHPMISRGDVMFDDPLNKDNNYCIFADIVKGKDTFRIYNVHLQSLKFQKDDYAVFGINSQNPIVGDKKSNVRLMLDKLRFAYPKRAEQAKKVVEHMEQSPYEVIICGDFNDTPLSYVYNTFYSRFTDAFKNSSSGIGITYAGKVPAGRIDYIFHSKKLHSTQFKIHQKVHSDHKAIECIIWK